MNIHKSFPNSTSQFENSYQMNDQINNKINNQINHDINFENKHTFENKYTKKIKQFLNNNFDEEIKEKINELKQFDDNIIIKKIFKLLKNTNTQNQKLHLIIDEKIKKIHEYQDNPLSYVILSSVGAYPDPSDNKATNIESYYDWIRTKSSTINLNDKKYSKYHDVLFNPSENRKELHNLMYKNIFVSADVVNHSESENLNYKVYKNENTEIHVYHPNSNSGPDLDIVMKIINFYRNLTIDKLMNDKSKTDLFVKIIVFYGEQKKYLPNEKNKSICSDNVNSGMSTKGESIQIWRKEEFYKVLIHELIHYFDIDFYLLDNIYNKINNQFKKFIKSKNINFNGIDRINESYTEVTAIVFHTCLYCHINNLKFSEVMAYEIIFSYFQTAKLLTHFDTFDTFDDLHNITFDQRTSAFSYYIIKCIFMENLNKFIDFWDQNGIVILNNNDIQTNYINLYTNILNKNNLLQKKIINKSMNLINLQKNNNFISKTMRMSVHQI